MVNKIKESTVLFTWEVNDRLKKYLQAHLTIPNLNLIFPEEISNENLLSLAPVADIIVGWRVDDAIKLNATRMKLYINPGAGIKHHIEFFRKLNDQREKKVVLINGHGNSYFTAQHAVALLLTVTNRVVNHHKWMNNGQWRKGDIDASSIPIRGRKIGLLGYGAVNSLVHRFLAGFDVEFHILKRDWSRERVSSYPTEIQKYHTNELMKFLEIIDILIIAVPETSQTIGLIDENALKRLSKNCILINLSRGSVVDEKSLFNCLREKRIEGAAIDVWYNYQPEADSKGRKYPYHYPFHELDNILLSPHRAASPFSDLKRWDEVIENILRFHQGKKEFLNVVSLENEY
jgi:phosphoglycerate dehydrogenase-like enzyme